MKPEPFRPSFLLPGTPCALIRLPAGLEAKLGHIVKLTSWHLIKVNNEPVRIWKTDPVIYRTDEGGQRHPQGFREDAFMSLDDDRIYGQLVKERREDAKNSAPMASYLYGRKFEF